MFLDKRCLYNSAVLYSQLFNAANMKYSLYYIGTSVLTLCKLDFEGRALSFEVTLIEFGESCLQSIYQ